MYSQPSDPRKSSNHHPRRHWPSDVQSEKILALVGRQTRACACMSDPRDLVVAAGTTTTRHTSFAFVTRLATASFLSLPPPSPVALLLLCPLQVFVRLASKHADVIRLCRPHHKCAPPPLRLPVTSCHARRARHLASLPSLVSRPSLDTHLTVYRFILPSSVSFLYISFVLDPSSFPWLSLDLLAIGYQTSPHFLDLAPAVAHRHSIHT